METRTALQAVSTSALLYAAYLSYKCPCTKLMSCHNTEFAAAIGVSVAAVAYDQLR